MVNILEENIVISTIIDFLLIVSPTIGYISQMIKILKLKSSKGFSKLIPFLMISASLLRIYFWIGKRFLVVYLLQSIVLIITQIILLYFCIIYSKEEKKEETYYLSIKTFWNWPFLQDYLFCYTAIVVAITILSSILNYDIYYCEVLGALSGIVETSVSIPQILENFRVKSENNFSYFLIFCWVSGDVLKTVLNIIKEAPFQLTICGFFQFCCDSFIVGQLFYYKKFSGNKKVEIEATI